jgi:GNAT superfamily N-acetyltransferase
MKQNIIYLSSIMFILLISYIFSKNIFEQFINPSIKEEILLRKCFNENELNSFKKYYDYTNIINIKDSIIFSTPNKVIQEIPKITWNGIFLNNLCVEPKLRNRGIGKEIVLKVIEQAKIENKDHIILQVAENNIYAIKLYETLGFVKYSKGITPDNIKVYIYVLYL